MIKAEIIADSKGPMGDRITTMLVTFPRIILAEFNTHRMFSRNTASSRAIPFEKMVKSVEEDPFIPIAWQKDHKGMQGIDYIEEELLKSRALSAWMDAKDYAIECATVLNGKDEYLTQEQEHMRLSVTKQLCNRLLEPFMWTTVLVTATEWENFFTLRCPRYEVPYTWDEKTAIFRSRKDATKHWEDRFKIDKLVGELRERDEIEWLKLNKGQAEIHMMALAEAMWDAYQESTPRELKAGEWHVPFEDSILSLPVEESKNGYSLEDYLMAELSPTVKVSQMYENYIVPIATTMGARTSYTVVGEDQKPLSYKRMLEIHDELLAANPKHMSPFEHCAKVMTTSEYERYGRNLTGNSIGSTPYLEEEGWCGNFRGFIQYRKMIPNENIQQPRS